MFFCFAVIGSPPQRFPFLPFLLQFMPHTSSSSLFLLHSAQPLPSLHAPATTALHLTSTLLLTATPLKSNYLTCAFMKYPSRAIDSPYFPRFYKLFYTSMFLICAAQLAKSGSECGLFNTEAVFYCTFLQHCTTGIFCTLVYY